MNRSTPNRKQPSCLHSLRAVCFQALHGWRPATRGVLYVCSIVCCANYAAQMPQQLGFTLPPPLRVVEVGSDQELDQALDQSLPGDRILLADGAYTTLSLIDIHGTPAAPIVICALNAGNVVFAENTNGRNAKLSNARHIILAGLRFTQADVWGVTIGPAYPEDPGVVGCADIVLYDCEIDHAGQSLLKINGNSRGIAIISCRLHHSGKHTGDSHPYAEGIYIGEGATQQDRSHNIRVLGNHLYDIGNERNWGEAIDIKGQTHDVLIEGNLIESVVVDSGGAITALLDAVDYPDTDANPRIVIRGNVIRGVGKRDGGWHAAGICVGANGIEVTGNHVLETEGSAFLALANAGNTEGVLLLESNSFEGAVSLNKQWGILLPSPLTIDNRDEEKGCEL